MDNTETSFIMNNSKKSYVMRKLNLSMIAVVSLMLVMIMGCSDQFLQVDPIGKAGEEQFYNTDDDATMGLIATYDVLQWSYAQDWNSIYMVKTLPTNETTAGGNGSGDQPPYQRLNDYTFSADNPAITASYQSLYYGVYRANKVINNVDPEASDVRNQVVAEAKFLRAFFYFELVSMFGDVPLNLKELAPSEYSQPRTPASEVYAQIETDLTEAISELPLKSEYGQADKFRASKGAAQALLGKAHLYQEEYDEAAAQFDNVISSMEYDLVSDYSKVFREETELGVESVFEIVYVKDQGYNWGNFPWGSRIQESNIHWQLAGPRTDNYNDNDGTGLQGGWGFLYPTEDMYNAFVNSSDSTRRVNSLLSEQELENRTGDTITGDPYDYEGYVRLKYGSLAGETSSEDGAVPALNYGTNIRLIRYADVLLMAAEAYHHSSDYTDNEALTELNKVRDRADLPPVTTSGQALMDDIKEERQLELAFEGVRYLDLIRWGDAASELGSLGFQSGKHELFPIPADEVRRNSEINENNPGWSGG